MGRLESLGRQPVKNYKTYYGLPFDFQNIKEENQILDPIF